LRPSLTLRALWLAAVLAPAAATRAPAAEAYPDSTIVDRFTLPNGLRVVARHVPVANSVVITACFQGGTSDDPRGREGLSHLLAEVAFTADAGDVPERTRTELASERPLGFGVRVLPRITQLTEIAAYPQFPGVLHQVCERLKGVRVEASTLDEAVRQVRSDLTQNYGAHPERLLYHGVSQLAGVSDAQALQRFASGQGLEKLGVAEIQRLESQRFVPANAVLVIVGNLYAYDVHRMLERELAGTPGGTPAPPIAWGRLDSARVALARPGISEPVGVMGVLGPALTDTLHPMFFANAVLLGSYLNDAWSRPSPPLTTRFQYSVADDPEMARYYPPITFTEPPRIDEEFHYSVLEFFRSPVDSVSFNRIMVGVAWLLGGPVPRDLLKRMRRDPSALSTLASNIAAREQYADESFWLDYRTRLAHRRGPNEAWWAGYFNDPSHQVQLVLSPTRP
jgi:hypothetical protein